jgi:hypothetical protein
MREIMRGLLAAIFVFGQTAFAFHHHDHGTVPVVRASGALSRLPDATISPSDGCFLCAAQIQPRVGAVAPLLPAAVVSVIAAPSFVLPSAPRDERSGRLNDRGPPAA